MLYRYKLADNKKNLNVNTRSVNGILLHKNRWFYSDSKLFSEKEIGPYAVEEISQGKDQPYIVNEPVKLSGGSSESSEESLNRVPDIPEAKSEFIKKPVRRIDYHAELRNRGFLPHELRGLTVEAEKKLLALDESL